MGFGDFFSNAWSAAKTSAKESVSKIVDESKEKVDSIAAGIKEKAAAAAGKMRQAEAAMEAKAVAAKDYVQEKATAAGDYAKEKAIAAKDYTAEQAEQMAAATKKTATAVAKTAQKAFNEAADKFSAGAGFVLVTCPQAVAKTAVAIKQEVFGEGIAADWDGKFLPNCHECSPTGSACRALKGSSTKPDHGKMPSAVCTKKPVSKIYFINGIRNTPAQNCEATKAISDAVCAEVIGVYNRTQGMAGDLPESMGNIFQTHPFGGDKPTNAMSEIMREAISKDPPEEITIYAHSQGGLITRESLFHVQEGLKKDPGMNAEEIGERMSKINIKSFGTAQHDWPNGPNYEQYTHPNDPVPKIIKAGDLTRRAFTEPPRFYGQLPNPDYAAQMEVYNAQFSDERQIIRNTVNTKDQLTQADLTGFSAHNMVNSYVPALEKQRKGSPAAKCENCPHK